MQPSQVDSPQDRATILRLRRGIGAVGVALPFVVLIGNALVGRRFTLLGSISGSYYTHTRNIFVGSMFAIGVFLISYRYRRLDDVLSTIAGALAIVVALFPTLPEAGTTTVTSTDVVIGRVHGIAAAALFLLLACFCIFLFTRSEPDTTGVTPRKRLRNRIYYACGGVILGALVLALASNALSASAYDTVKPLFWCEAIAVLAFGSAWMIKGETLFRDPHAPVDAPGAAGAAAPAPRVDPAGPTAPVAPR